MRELSTELEKGEKEFEKLSQYIKEYKTRTTEKVASISDVIVVTSVVGGYFKVKHV